MMIEIDMKRCKGCQICVSVCPKQVLVPGTEYNAAGAVLPTAQRPELCIGCLMCERICPDLCIDIRKE